MTRSGICTNVSDDPINCGGCGTVCDLGDSCVSDNCAPDCAAGATLCGLQCVNTESNANHRGAADRRFHA